jgi:hypothetical protein
MISSAAAGGLENALKHDSHLSNSFDGVCGNALWGLGGYVDFEVEKRKSTSSLQEC